MNMRKFNQQSAFTLVEVVMVAGILVFCITAMLQLYVFTSVQAEMAGNKTQALSEAQNIIEDIRNASYAQISTNYGQGGTPGNVIALAPPAAQITGSARVYIDSNQTYISGTNTELLGVLVVVSFRNKYGRIVGEDLDLDGVLDNGEDLNNNSRLDSPVTLMSMITRR